MSDYQFKAGDEVEIRENFFVGILRDINPNPNYKADDETWAEVERSPGNVRDINGPEDIGLVREASKVPAKALPTMVQMVDFLQSALLAEHADIEINETDRNGEPEGEIQVYGISPSGQPFGARVKVVQIMWADE